jgi:hypothetical protein
MIIELAWRVESPARSQDRHRDHSTLYVALGSDKRSLGKMTCRKRRGNSWRLRFMDSAAGCARCWRRHWGRGCLRLPAPLRHGLLLRDLILRAPLDSVHHEVNQRHQDKNAQKNDLFKAQVFRRGLLYLFSVSARPFPVSAIPSRMAVSACMFFIR